MNLTHFVGTISGAEKDFSCRFGKTWGATVTRRRTGFRRAGCRGMRREAIR
jgi:hypothetical protein